MVFPIFNWLLNNAMNIEVIELENDFLYTSKSYNRFRFFHIEDASDKGTISVYNVMGQLLTSKEFEGSYNAFIDMESYKSGIYYYTLEAKYSHKGKIIKR